MNRSFLALLLAALCTACVGTGIGNPDAKGPSYPGGTDGGAGGAGGSGGSGGTGGTGGSGGGNADGDVLPAPQVIDFGTSCPGGVARAWLDLANQSGFPVLVELESDAPIALAPSALEIDALGMARLAVVHTAAPDSDADGTIRIAWQGGTATVGWTLRVDAGQRQRGQALCGGEGPCEAAILAGPAGATLEAPLALVNDGCEDLVLTSFEADGAGRLPELLGPPLPATLAPGESYEGLLRLEAAGQESGSFRFLLGDEGQSPELPWSTELTTAP